MINSKKANLRFNTELEKKIHRIISTIKYGEEIIIDVDTDIKEILKAIKKSLFYNCINDAKVTKLDDKTKIKVKIDY